RFIARTLYVLAAQSIRFLVASRELLLHSQRDLDGQRCHRLDDDIADSLIERAAVHGLAETTFAPLQRAPAAPVGRYTLIAVRMVADRHPFTATSADHHPLEQRCAFACRSTVPLGAPGERIPFHALEVRLILLPGNVARMHVAQQDPFLAWHQAGAHLAI